MECDNLGALISRIQLPEAAMKPAASPGLCEPGLRGGVAEEVPLLETFRQARGRHAKHEAKRVRPASMIRRFACGCCQNRCGIHFWLVGEFTPSEPILVVGCSLGVRDFEPWPCQLPGNPNLPKPPPVQIYARSGGHVFGSVESSIT